MTDAQFVSLTDKMRRLAILADRDPATYDRAYEHARRAWSEELTRRQLARQQKEQKQK